MIITQQTVLKTISNDDIEKNLDGLDRLSLTTDARDPKASYIFDRFRKTFANLPLRQLPKELGDQYLSEFFKMVRELINENKSTFEECSNWAEYNAIAKKVYAELAKDPHDFSGGW